MTVGFVIEVGTHVLHCTTDPSSFPSKSSGYNSYRAHSENLIPRISKQSCDLANSMYECSNAFDNEVDYRLLHTDCHLSFATSRESIQSVLPNTSAKSSSREKEGSVAIWGRLMSIPPTLVSVFFFEGVSGEMVRPVDWDIGEKELIL